MAINDLSYNEVRLRNQSEFIQIPNTIQAASALVDGTFVYYDTSGQYDPADQNTEQTHLVIRSGTHRLTAAEIATLSGTIQAGEPCIAVTGGPGVATIPFGADVQQGNDLTTDANGLAVAWNADSGDTGAYLIGKALEDVSVDADGNRWGLAMITLPGRYSPLTTV